MRVQLTQLVLKTDSQLSHLQLHFEISLKRILARSSRVSADAQLTSPQTPKLAVCFDKICKWNSAASAHHQL
jgi:hypothetical protein